MLPRSGPALASLWSRVPAPAAVASAAAVGCPLRRFRLTVRPALMDPPFRFFGVIFGLFITFSHRKGNETAIFFLSDYTRIGVVAPANDTPPPSQDPKLSGAPSSSFRPRVAVRVRSTQKNFLSDVRALASVGRAAALLLLCFCIMRPAAVLDIAAAAVI